MKARIYLETTIVSYLVARPSSNVTLAGHQAVTRAWWSRRRKDFDIFISDTVLAEASAGEVAMAKKRLALLKPFDLLSTPDEALELADALIHGGPLPVKAQRDALHIAVAAVHGIHFLLTWNCKHIANARMLGKVAEICSSHGVDSPVICTPDELIHK